MRVPVDKFYINRDRYGTPPRIGAPGARRGVGGRPPENGDLVANVRVWGRVDWASR